MATLSFTESNGTPSDPYTLKTTISFTDSNATPVDAFTLGGLAYTNPLQIWSVQIHGTVAEGAFVARDNGGILP